MKRRLSLERLENRHVLSAVPWMGPYTPPYTDYELDPTFGVNGVAHFEFADYQESGYRFAAQGDKIVVFIAARENAAPFDHRFDYAGFVRFNADGMPDLSFGDGGGVLVPVNDSSTRITVGAGGFVINDQTPEKPIYLSYSGAVVSREPFVSYGGDWGWNRDLIMPDGSIIEYAGHDYTGFESGVSFVRFRPPTPQPSSEPQSPDSDPQTQHAPAVVTPVTVRNVSDNPTLNALKTKNDEWQIQSFAVKASAIEAELWHLDALSWREGDYGWSEPTKTPRSLERGIAIQIVFGIQPLASARRIASSTSPCSGSSGFSLNATPFDTALAAMANFSDQPH